MSLASEALRKVNAIRWKARAKKPVSDKECEEAATAVYAYLNTIKKEP